MFSEDVTTKNGVVKHVVAQSQEELDEAVKAIKAEETPTPPDINDPEDGNKIVSPDNLHTEPIPTVVDNSVEAEEPKEEVEEDKPKKVSKPKK